MTTYATAPVAPLPLSNGKGTLMAYTASGGTAPDFYAGVANIGGASASLSTLPATYLDANPSKWPAGYARLFAALIG